MGRSLASSLIGQGVCLPKNILVVDPDAGVREGLRQMGCQVVDIPDERMGEAPVVVLAVKPQSAQEVFTRLQPLLKKNQVVVSIMAGVTMSALREGLKHDALVRVMPNMPARVGLGMNVFYSDPSLSSKQAALVETLLKSSGEMLRVSSEDAIDAATAISGSGPAYVFYVAEHWMKIAQTLGFSQEEAEKLVQQTLLGATALWKEMTVPVATLREQVTSKGGTTAAALEFFDTNSLGSLLEEGMEKAYQRAKEMGN